MSSSHPKLARVGSGRQTRKIKHDFTRVSLDLPGKMHTGLILLMCLLHYVAAQDSGHCCQKVVGIPACFEACSQISGSSSEEAQLHQLTHVAGACSKDRVDFWLCINNTVIVIRPIVDGVWPGRFCCQLPLSTPCQNTCKRAKSRSDLGNNCLPSYEFAFYNCLERQEVSARCCSRDSSTQCRAVCKAIFIQDSVPTSSQEQMINEFCAPSVAQCVHNYTKEVPSRSPSESLPCCDRTESDACRTNCRMALQTLTSEEEIITGVMEHCGNPNPAVPLWQCFLMGSTNNIKQVYDYGGRMKVTGVDGAKLQCCTKAVTERCRDLCLRTYSREFSHNVNLFHGECRYHHNELELNMCLDEVDEPCQLGCSGMEYCSNFNHRPTELFRSCNKISDTSARNAINLWSHGIISLPMMEHNIAVKNIKECKPELWKSIACTLQIRPCQRQTHSTRICIDDCIEILHTCLDYPNLHPSLTAESICDTLSPRQNKEASCISLSEYLVESPYKDVYREVTNPCNPNPCGPNSICQINRRQCKQKGKCLPYECKPGCAMGEVLSHLVPHNSHVRIPTAATRQLNCYRVCECGHHSMLRRCRDMQCLEESDCPQAGSGRIENHNSRFNLSCNKCACYAGEMVCTWRYCLSSRPTELDRSRYTGLPCNCDGEYQPVCGVNGKTFPNGCLARCASLMEGQYHPGTCISKNSCSHNPCPPNTRCLPRRQTCMSKTTECKQYECVSLEGGCPNSHHDPVCDSEGEEWNNSCVLVKKNRFLAYRGHCLRGCDGSGGVVCGVNGESYRNECEAWSDNVPVDYVGQCHAVGQLLDYSSLEPHCVDVQCPAGPRNRHCQPITPPGACCPQCAGELRVLYSRQQMETASRVSQQGPITVSHVVDILRQHMSVSQCDVFGYLSIEGDLVVLIMPVVVHPTPLQIQACLRETEKIGSLISSNSPTLTSHIAISTFLSADIRTAKTTVTSVAASSLRLPSPVITLVWTLLLSVVQAFRWR